MRRYLIMLVLALFLQSVGANPVVTDVNIEGKIDGGGGFIGSSDINIVFSLRDNNISCIMQGTAWDANIYYSTTKGANTTAIVTDLNLGDVNRNMGYCSVMPGVACSTAAVRCEYTLPATTVNSITDNNYFIDVNVTSILATAGGTIKIADFNMDSNNSFYVDNGEPVCSINEKRGDQFDWEITGEEPEQAVGSTTTMFYKKEKTASYSSTIFNGTVVSLSDNLTSGTKEYSCYATDSALNTGSTVTKEISYNAATGSVSIGAVTVTPSATSGTMSIFGGTSGSVSPIIIIIGLLVLVVLLYYLFIK